MRPDQATVPTQAILEGIEVPESVLENWQITTDLLAKLAGTPAALIMRAHPDDIEVLVSSRSEGNVYRVGERSPLDLGLYCKTVMDTRHELMVANALKDPLWDENPDIALGMISYCGLPLTWPGGQIFGTICVLDSQENIHSQLTREVMQRFRDAIEYGLEGLFNASVERAEGAEEVRQLNAQLDQALTTERQASAALAVERETLHAILEALPLCVGVSDVGGRVVELNAATKTLWGDAPKPEGVEGYDTYKAWFVDTGRRLGSDDWQMACAIRTGEPVLDELLEIERFDGGHRFIKSSALPFRDPDGRIAGYIGVSDDITDLIELRNRLQETTAALERAERIAHVGHWHWDESAGTLTWSDGMFDILGLDRATFEPTPTALSDMLVADDGTRPDGRLSAALDGVRSESIIYRLPGRDGDRFLEASPVERELDPAGRPVGAFGTLIDITERERAARDIVRLNDELEEQVAALGTANEQLNLVLEASDAGLWDWDIVQGTFTWSDTLFVLFGLDPAKDAAGFESWNTALHPDDADAANERIARALEGHHALNSDYRIVRPSGEVRWVNALGHGVYDAAGEPVRMTGIVIDITDRVRGQQDLARLNRELEDRIADRKSAEGALLELTRSLEARVIERTHQLDETIEQLTVANEAKTRFLRSMSHELRTPLNSVIGFASLLADGAPGPINEEQERQLRMIESSGQHLLALINDILDLSKIEAGATELHWEPIDVAGLVAEVASECRPAAEAKQLTLTVNPCEPGPTVTSDVRSVRQILFNLVGNAIKFTNEGSIVLSFSQPVAGRVAVSVSDTGPGIGLDERARIFAEFEQGTASAPDQEGTGLGLAISRELTSALGGTLEVESRMGFGSTFTLRLPVNGPRRPGS